MNQSPLVTVPRTKKPILAWPALIAFVGFVVLQIRFGWASAKVRATGPDYVISYWMGGTVGVMLICGACAWVAYRLARRSTLAGTITFVMMMLLACLSVFAQSARRGELVVKRVVEPLAAKRELAEHEVNQLMAAQIMRLDGLDSPGEVDRRLAMIERAIQSNADFLAAGDRIRDALNTRLMEADVSQPRRAQYLRQFDLSWIQGRRLHSTYARIFAAFQDFFQFLREHDGQWHYDATNERLLFDDDHLVEQFRALGEEVKRSSAELSGS